MLPEEICEECQQTIGKRARANVFRDRVLCSKCHRKIARPATDGQVAFMRGLGFSPPSDVTCAEARWTLDRAREIRFYTYQLAREEWGINLPGIDLSPIVQVVFKNPAICERIYAFMVHNSDQALKRQAQIDAAHAGDPHYEQPNIRDFILPLPRDEDYRLVRTGLWSLGIEGRPDR